MARFAKDRRGIAALEFGMVSIPFLGLLCAIFETAFVYYNHEVFDNAVINVARQILVGQYSTTAQTASDFKTTTGANGYSLCGALPSYFDCDKVILNISTPTNDLFGSLNGTVTNSFITNPSANITVPAPGSIVVFQAYYPMPIYLSVLLARGANGNQAANLYGQSSNTVRTNPITGSGLVHDIYSVMVFRNEPQ
nr:TadE/TadG family type IV pilus assembly protein [Rhodoblastus acidophilus]